MENVKIFSKIKSLNTFLKTQAQVGSHAYLLTSADKKTLEIASVILALNFACEQEAPCLSCSKCLKILNKTSVDFYSYPKPKKKNIVVDDVKEIIETVQNKPLDFDKKIYVLNNIESATLSAQNKLLKTLEEPPQNTVFILTAKSEKAVIPTIASRTQTVMLPLINKEEVKQALTGLVVEPKKLAIASEGSLGYLGKALEILNNEAYYLIYDFCINLISNMKTSSQVVEYSHGIIKNYKFVDTYFEVLENLFRDLMLIKADAGDLVVNKFSLDKLVFASENYSQTALIKILELIERSKQKLEYNTNPTGVIDTLLIGILEVKHKWK